MRLLIPQVPRQWRALFATAVYTGMRRGELVALHKADVDLDPERPTITVCRSWDADSTKSGEPRVIPVHPELAPHLASAIASSPSALVFPRPDGTMHTREIDLPRILRSAMARAGLVKGWLHKCRRCGQELHAQDDTIRRCDDCGMKLWPCAIKREERFHDLRHTTATLLLKAGASLAVVQRLCGHADPTITMETYGHLVAEDAREPLSRLSFAPDHTRASARPSSAHTRGTAPALRNRRNRKTEGPDPLRFPETNQGLSSVGETGFEPATPWSRTKCSTRLSHSPNFRLSTANDGRPCARLTAPCQDSACPRISCR